MKAAKAQKKARREAAKKQRIRKVEQMLLTHGWNGLDDTALFDTDPLLVREQAGPLLCPGSFDIIEDIPLLWHQILLQNAAVADGANGIQVPHAADSLKAAKAQKKARREAAKKQRIRKVEQIKALQWLQLGHSRAHSMGL